MSETNSNRPVVIIYRERLLLPSQTFVRSQAQALENFRPYFVGCARVANGIPLPGESSCTVNDGGLLGRVREFAFSRFGVAATPDLIRHLRAMQPVLIHVHFGLDGVRGLELAQKLEIPMLITYHGFDATIKPSYGRHISFAYRRYLRHKNKLKNNVPLFLAVSSFVKRTLVDQGFPAERIHVHYVGVDTEQFQPTPDISREPIVLFVGRLVENKGCEYLIAAMSAVQEVLPQVELVIIGDGVLRKSLEAKAKQKLRHYRFLGSQSHEEVRAWMNRAQVFSVPSVTALSGTSEGFGLVFAEAQAMGLPVVSFVTGGIPEAVVNGTTGFLVPERDVSGLANSIILLFQQSQLWGRFSAAAVAHVRSRFDLLKQTRELEQIYRRLIARKSCAAEPVARVFQ